MKLYKYYLYNSEDYLIVEIKLSDPLVSLAWVKETHVNDVKQKAIYDNIKNTNELIVISNKRIWV